MPTSPAHWPEQVHAVRGLVGCCHFLEDGPRSVFIDSGLLGEPILIRRLFHRLGRRPSDVAAIILTHGHLDHTGNLAWLQAWTGAPVYAHPADSLHIQGRYPYIGPSRWCGRLEHLGRAINRYHVPTIQHDLSDGLALPYFGGLRVIHLPGHTAGHCGFSVGGRDLMFTGDLFASYWFSIHPPPAILNTDPAALEQSLQRVREFAPAGIIPNHYDRQDTGLHRARFERMMDVRAASSTDQSERENIQ